MKWICTSSNCFVSELRTSAIPSSRAIAAGILGISMSGGLCSPLASTSGAATNKSAFFSMQTTGHNLPEKSSYTGRWNGRAQLSLSSTNYVVKNACTQISKSI